jgi:hypothetical protein
MTFTTIPIYMKENAFDYALQAPVSQLRAVTDISIRWLSEPKPVLTKINDFDCAQSPILHGIERAEPQKIIIL